MSSILGDRIRITRERKGIMQKRLAKAIGISNVQLSRYETGDRNPDPETLKKIADFLEVSTDYLLGRTDDPASSESPSKPQEEPIVQFIMRSKKEMTPQAFSRWEQLIRDAKKAFVEEVEREEKEKK